MTITLEPIWNGVREERRNNVSDIGDMPVINGDITVDFIKNNTVVSSVKKELLNNKVVFDNYVDSKLAPGKYDIKISFDAFAANPMYANTESTYMSKLTVKSAATEKNVINTVVIESVKTPIIGDNIRDYRAPYIATESVLIDKLGWQYYDAEDDDWYNMSYISKFPEESDVFEKGKRYRARFTFDIEDETGYTFPKTKEELTVFINGKQAENCFWL